MTVRVAIDQGVAVLTLDAPPLNILTRAVLQALREAIGRAGDDPEVRVVVLLGQGKHFSAGADVGEHLPPTHEQMIPEFMATVTAVQSCPVPVVAGVRGKCLGGGFELVQAADVVVAGESAQFGQPEIVLGVLPPAACALLPTLGPWGVAADLVLSGDSIDAPEAMRAGLVRRVVPDGRVEAEAMTVAGRMARHSRAALTLGKRALLEPRRAGLAAALSGAQRIYLDDLMNTADALEGLQAFQEKRAAVWRHR